MQGSAHLNTGQHGLRDDPWVTATSAALRAVLHVLAGARSGSSALLDEHLIEQVGYDLMHEREHPFALPEHHHHVSA